MNYQDIVNEQNEVGRQLNGMVQALKPHCDANPAVKSLIVAISLELSQLKTAMELLRSGHHDAAHSMLPEKAVVASLKKKTDNWLQTFSGNAEEAKPAPAPQPSSQSKTEKNTESKQDSSKESETESAVSTQAEAQAMESTKASTSDSKLDQILALTTETNTTVSSLSQKVDNHEERLAKLEQEMQEAIRRPAFFKSKSNSKANKK